MASLQTEKGADAHDATGFANNASAFASQGYQFVAQYIDQYADANTAGSPSVTKAQVQQESAAGLQIMSIFQTNGMSSSYGTLYQTYFTANQGTADAAEAVSSAQALGQPAGSSIYFAMDFDPAVFGAAGSEKALLTNVQTYLTAVAKGLQASGYTIGVYGAGDTLAATIRNNSSSPNYNAAYTPVATHGWLTQSYGWAGSNTQTDANAMGWDVYQGAQTTANGVAIDPDTATTTSFGEWVACFVAGTRISTSRGEVPVEHLAIGDLVVTDSGRHRPIRWLGRRSYIGRFANRNPDVLPICFKAGSLADGVPTRDLWVSPKHAMFIDGALVPAEHLVDGVSVVKVTRVERVDYHHVELDSHDVLLAEGAPSESFVDDNSRQIFQNAHEHAGHRPDAPRAPAIYCAPRLEHGAALAAIRLRIADRACDGRPSTAPGRAA